MTQEEKAKRYDDLLVKLQKAKTDNNVCDDRYCCVIDIIVPELKKSEDERIRKQLIEHTKWSYDEQEISEEEKERWISWLEKQGEQILANSAKTCKDGQKPAWSEKDEEYFDDIARTLRSFVITGGSEAKRYTEEEINWLKSLKDRVQPQPKQEWSEEDEIILTNLIYALANDRIGNSRDEYVNWLKSIRPQNRWKPSDEQIFELECVVKQNKDNMLGKNLQLLLEQLKNLK